MGNVKSRLGLQEYYEVQKAEIIGRRNQTSFTFHGLRDQSVHNIKSLVGADILWVEDAQNVSKKSWRTVIPTIRKPGSEIWVSFTPELETDDTYKRFVLSPPANAVVVKTSWRHNPALSDELRVEIEHLRANRRGRVRARLRGHVQIGSQRRGLPQRAARRGQRGAHLPVPY